MTGRTVLEYHAGSLAETESFVKEVLPKLTPGTTMLLFGNLGSGKTHLVKLWTAMLGSRSEATSPSFSLINQYDGPVFINHLDLYRIADARELINLGLDDLWDSGAVNFVEWPQLVEQSIDWPHLRLEISINGENKNGRLFKLVQYD
jgi:tRNA threonylcarbamoyladenosine biosynthesis protein TsaE